MNRTDESMMGEFKKSLSSEALKELIERHQEWAFNLSFSVLHNGADAEEATQQAFVDLIRSSGTYRDGAPFRPWFGRIVVNDSLKMMRSAERRAHRERHAARIGETQGMNRIHETVQSALQELDPQLKVALVLCYQQGFTQAEAAEMLGVLPRTVSDLVRRGLEDLKRRVSLAGFAIAAPAIAEALGQTSLQPVPASLTMSLRDLPPRIASILSAPKGAAVPLSSSLKLPAIVALTAILATAGMYFLALKGRERVVPDGRLPGESAVKRQETARDPGLAQERGISNAGATDDIECEIAGIVIRARDRKPLAGARIDIELIHGKPVVGKGGGLLARDGSEGFLLDTRTDSGGRFQFKGLRRPGWYELRAEYQLYISRSVRVDGTASGRREVILVMEDGTASATIAAFDDAGAPVAGWNFKVQCMDWLGEPQEVTTDSRGEGTVLDLPAGRYRAGGEGVAYCDFALKKGENKRLELVVCGSATITGAILTESGESASGLTVRASLHVTGTSRERTAGTDESGQYAIRNLAAGSYRVEVIDEGRAEPVASEKVELDRGQTRRVDFKVRRASVQGPATLEGVVLDAATKKAVPDAALVCWTSGTRTKSDAQGRFSFEFKKCMLVHLRADAPHYQGGERYIELQPGRNVTSIELQAAGGKSGRTLKGRATFKNGGGAVKGMRVMAVSADGLPVGDAAVIGSDGSFRLAIGHDARLLRVLMDGWEQEFEVQLNDGEDIELELPSSESVLGGTVEGLGAPGLVTVMLEGQGIRSLRMVQATKDPRFAFMVPSGTYALKIAFASANSLLSLSTEVQLLPGDEKNVEPPAAPGNGGIRGTILAGGAPFLQARATTVVLSTAGAGWTVVREAPQDARGQYEILGLAPGSYRFEWQLTSEKRGLAIETIQVTDKIIQKDLVLPFSGTLEIRVETEGGKDLFTPSKIKVFVPGTGQVVISKESGVTLYGAGWPALLPPGTYGILASSEGFTECQDTVTIAEQGPISKTLRLRPR